VEYVYRFALSEKETKMNVRIKKFEVEMEIKNKGVEIEVRTPDGKTQVGDVLLTKTGVTWCKGKTAPENGKKVTWKRLIELIESES